MKVVLFCGGLGMRMRSGPESLPKPMMPIGSRPVLWHVMRYYAHFGHTEFILALGFGAQSVKDYFLHYEETASNDFVLTKGGAHVELLGSDISDWTITFIDTGMDTPIGERLRRVRPYLEDDEVFLANYGDVLTDAPMNEHRRPSSSPTDAVGSLLAVRPQDSFHVVGDRDGRPDHRASSRWPTSPSGSTAATSCCARRSSTTWAPTRTSSWTPASTPPPTGRMRAVRVRRVLGTHGHPQGTRRPRGDVPPRRMPLGAVAGGQEPSRPADHPVEGMVPVVRA